MAAPASKILILGVLGVVVIAGIVVYARELLKPREYELKSATIAKLDFERQGDRIIAARGELEFVHPKSGQKMTVTGTIPADCPIEIDGTPAGLADLRVGDAVAARGTLFADRSLRPQWVRVQRSPLRQPTSTSTQAAEPR